MKLYIDLQDYQELIDIDKERTNTTSYKFYRFLHYLLIVLAILSLIIALINFFKIEWGLGFTFLSLVFIFIGSTLSELSNKYKNAIAKSLSIKDIKSPIEILNYHVSNNNDVITNQFYFEYFNDDDVLQSKRFYFDKAYTHKKDYYRIVGKFDEKRKNYRFYLYEPYLPLCCSNSDSVNKDIKQAKNVTININ